MGLRVTIRSALNIHYPTDSSLLLDGIRVLTRTMNRIVEIGGKAGEQVRIE
jgi:IS5 family transposase